MNKNGFAVSGIIYSLLILFLLLLFGILSIMGARKMILDKLKNEVMEELNGNGEEIGLVGIPIIEKAKELVYSNGTCKTDGSTYQYMGGCYIKGNPNNNYIWYSGFLWRIMGINVDGTIKMVVNENVTAISWGDELTPDNWNNSYAKDWLNNYFYPKLKGNDIIVNQTWCSELATDGNSSRTTCTNNLSKEKSKVGLITLDEYNLSGSENSYLNIKQWQYTMTPDSENSFTWAINSSGDSNNYEIHLFQFGIRPVINVNSNTIITGGNGEIFSTWNDKNGPYILNDEKFTAVTGSLKEKSIVGEYVLFSKKLYRIVNKDSNGNIKIILDGYYNYESYDYNDFYPSILSNAIEMMNTDLLEWLVPSNDIVNRNKLVKDYIWYKNDFFSGDYKDSLKESDDSNKINSTVGVIRIGEILSSQSGSLLTDGYKTLSDYNNVHPYLLFNSLFIKLGGYVDYDSDLNIRPMIVIKSDVNIISGTGIWSNPYQI